MRIDAATGTALVALFRAKEAGDEIEARYTGPLDRAMVVALLRYLRSTGPKKASRRHEAADDTLDISVEEKDDGLQLGARGGKQLRVTVHGGEEVLRAVLDDGRWPDAYTVMRKGRVRAPVEIPEYRIRVNMKHEEVLADPETRGAAVAAVDRATGARKTYRLKRRFSFPTADGAFRVDVTGVRQATGTAFSYTALAAVAERYEVEVEHVGRGETPATSEAAQAAARLLVQHANVLLKVIDDTDAVLALSEKRAVLAEYLGTVAPAQTARWTALLLTDEGMARSAEGGGGGGKRPGGGRVERPPTAHDFFVGPKPVTLELRQLIPGGVAPDEPSLCNLDNAPYTVTEKADGVRRLLFVAASGKAYTIDDRLAVRGTNLLLKGGGAACLLDGEFLLVDRAATFMCFDAYHVDGVDVCGSPLMLQPGTVRAKANVKAADRLSHARAVIARLGGAAAGPSLSVRVKDFRHIGVSKLAAAVRWMLAKRDAGDFPYEIDGLIFTPAQAAVGALAVGGKANLAPGRWTSAFKWKPPELNTIDFLVRLRPSGEVVTRPVLDLVRRDVYRVVDLLVGYNPAKFDPVTTWSIITSPDRPAAGHPGRQEYVARVFAIPGVASASTAPVAGVCHLRMTGAAGAILCANGEEIVDNTIVEFAYAVTLGAPHSPFMWRPLRLRPEKTETYLSSGGNISFTANDMATALGVWRSIHAPVTEDMLAGRKPLPEEAPREDDTYYARGQRRQEGSATAGLRAFHNAWVKGRSLLLRFGDGGTRTLFDVGCGRGGDIQRWVEMRVSRVLGIDVSSSGITNPDAALGANARLRQMRTNNRRQEAPNIRVVFLPLDASRPIDAQAIEALDEASNDRLVGRVAWGLVAAASVADARLRSYHGFALGGFDLTTCMFAAHYFFEDRVRLAAFCGNVAKHLRQGGHFVGCCLDGHRVDQLLRGVPEGGSVQGGGGDTGTPLMWRITRMYADDLDDIEPDRNVGRAIKVYMESIGQALQEYLVDYRLLRSAMADVGLVPPDAAQLQTLGFPEAEQDSAGTGTFDALFRALQKSPVVGHTPALVSALAMSGDEKRISFLNRWFVFVRRGT